MSMKSRAAEVQPSAISIPDEVEAEGAAVIFFASSSHLDGATVTGEMLGMEEDVGEDDEGRETVYVTVI